MLKEKQDLLVFGYGLGVIAAVFGIGAWFKHGFGFAVIVLFLCSMVFLSVTAWDWTALKFGFHAWMKIAHLIGRVVTTAILSVVFFFIFTPVGLLLRLLGKDHLQRDFSRRAKTYWEKRNQEVFLKQRYHQQF